MSEWRAFSRACDDGHTYVAGVPDPSMPDGWRYYIDPDTGRVLTFGLEEARLVQAGMHPAEILKPPPPLPPIVLNRPPATHSDTPPVKKRGRPKKVG